MRASLLVEAVSWTHTPIGPQQTITFRYKTSSSTRDLIGLRACLPVPLSLLHKTSKWSKKFITRWKALTLATSGTTQICTCSLRIRVAASRSTLLVTRFSFRSRSLKRQWLIFITSTIQPTSWPSACPVIWRCQNWKRSLHRHLKA